jgi:rhodanese-related sulfurtransferase
MELISTDQLKERMDKNEALNLVDVREDHERVEFNIGGIHIPLGKIETMEIDPIEHLKNEEVICYCRAGSRSMRACMMLETMGFTNVKNLTGGMMEWQSKF